MRRVLWVCIGLGLCLHGFAQSTAMTLLKRTTLSLDLLQPTGALLGYNRIGDLGDYTLAGISAELHHALPTHRPQMITLDVTSSLWGIRHDSIPPWSAYPIGVYPRTRDRFVLLGYRCHLSSIDDSFVTVQGLWFELQAGLNHRWSIVNHDMLTGFYFRDDRYLLPCFALRFGHDWRLGKHWVLSPNVGIRANRLLLRDIWHRFVSIELNVGRQF
jgi:hypothetical protein